MHAPRSHKVPTQLAFHKLHKRAEQWPLKGRDSSQVPWVLSPGDAVRRWQGAAQCSAPRQPRWAQAQLLTLRAL